MDSRSVLRQLAPHLAIGVVAAPVGYAVAAALGVERDWRVVAGTLIPVCVSLYMKWSVTLSVRATELTCEAMLPVNRRDSSPPVGFSHAEAAAARGDVAEAARLFGELLTAHGFDEALCRAAVDFHVQHGDPKAAETILRRMRRDEPQRFEHYATQRLIDLYLGRAADSGRAMTELRRLADRNPGTAIGAGALRALTALRERDTAGHQGALPAGS